MFKSATIFKLETPQPILAATMESKIAANTFEPCGLSQHHAWGWVPPRGEANGALVESVSGQLIMRLRIETKTVPAAIIQQWLDRQCAITEAATGRKPGRKERKELKEQATLELLPKAFPKTAVVTLWIDPQAGRLVLDTTSSAHVDDAITALVKAGVIEDGFSVEPFNTNTAPTVAMARWLAEQAAPEGFAIGKACELKSEADDRAVVRYARHPLLTEEVQAHLKQGKIPTRLALEWDDRVAFTLTAGLQLTGIEFQDVVFEGRFAGQGEFDGNVIMVTAELSRLITDLATALDGEAESAPSSAEPSPATE